MPCNHRCHGRRGRHKRNGLQITIESIYIAISGCWWRKNMETFYRIFGVELPRCICYHSAFGSRTINDDDDGVDQMVLIFPIYFFDYFANAGAAAVRQLLFSHSATQWTRYRVHCQCANARWIQRIPFTANTVALNTAAHQQESCE